MALARAIPARSATMHSTSSTARPSRLAPGEPRAAGDQGRATGLDLMRRGLLREKGICVARAAFGARLGQPSRAKHGGCPSAQVQGVGPRALRPARSVTRGRRRRANCSSDRFDHRGGLNFEGVAGSHGQECDGARAQMNRVAEVKSLRPSETRRRADQAPVHLVLVPGGRARPARARDVVAPSHGQPTQPPDEFSTLALTTGALQR